MEPIAVLCANRHFKFSPFSFFYFGSAGYDFNQDRASFSFALQSLCKKLHASNRLFLFNSDVDVTGIS